MRISGGQFPATCRWGATFVLLAGLLPATGCTAWLVAKAAKTVLSEETTVNITVKGDETKLGALVPGLQAYFGVKAVLSSDPVTQGVRVLKLVGSYAEMLKSLRWIAFQGLELLANDARTAEIIQAALVFGFKSAG